MPIWNFAVICASTIVLSLSIIYLVLLIRRKNGKSDVRESRITLVVASFVIPIVVTALFVGFALIAQQFYEFRVPVGQRGGGVFIVFLVNVATSVVTLLILLPRIKHKWDD
jgi:predicted transporter